MSEKLPESRPVLVPRNNGNIEVWHKTGMLDGHGNHEVISQVPEEIDGEISLVKKYVPQELFSSEVQDDYAEELGMDRPKLTPEELDRHFKADKDLGEVSLSAVDVKSPDVADESAYADHLKHLQGTRLETAEVKETVASSALVDSLVDGIVQAAKGKITNGKGDHVYSPDEIKKQYKSFAEKLGNPDVDIDNLLRAIPRAGGLRDTVETALKNGSLEDLKKAIADSLVKSPDVAADQESQESQEVVSEPQSDVERIDKALKEAEASLPEQDRTPVWHYAIAINDNERNRALDKMSWKTRDSRAYLQYADLFRQFQAAREKAK